MAPHKQTVLVTGASGYIAKHIVRQLLEAGYRVRGSVRNLERGAEVRHAVTAGMQDAADDALEFVALDLNADDGWPEALDGVDALLHTASPFPMVQPDNADDLIRPAIDGTLRALKAAAAAGVDRVVLTSSSVAIIGNDAPSNGVAFSEADWTDPDAGNATPYARSKTLAERTAWDFVANQPQMKLTTINPGLVVGPPLDENFGTSVALVERVLKRQDPALPDVGFPVVDVRDIAAMHVRALHNSDSAGERIAGIADFIRFVDIASALKEGLPGRKIVTFVAPHFLIRIIGLFDKSVRTIIPDLGKTKRIDNTKAKALLDIDFADPRAAIVDTANFLLDRGLVK